MHTDKLVLTYSNLFRTFKTWVCQIKRQTKDNAISLLHVLTWNLARDHRNLGIRLSFAVSKALHHPPTHLKDAVAVLRQRCRRVGRVHLRELFGKVTDVQLVPDDGLEGGRHLVSCQVLPVDFLKWEKNNKVLFKQAHTAWTASRRHLDPPGRMGVSSHSRLHSDLSPVFSLDLWRGAAGWCLSPAAPYLWGKEDLFLISSCDVWDR